MSSTTSPPEATPDNTVDIVDFWQRLVRHARLILGFAVGAAAIALGLVLLSHPQFTASGSLYTGGATASASGGDNADSSASGYLSYLATFQAVTDVETEADILRSPDEVEQAVMATGLNATLTSGPRSALRYWAWRFRHHRQIGVFQPGRGDLTAQFASFSDPSIIQQSYTVTFGPAGQYEIAQAGNIVLDGIIGRPASGGGISLLLNADSPGYAPAPGTLYQLTLTAPTVTAAQIIGGALIVTPGGTATLPSDVINIAMRWRNPYAAREFVNQLMNIYIANTVSWNSSAAGAMEDFISQQLQSVHASMTSADQALATYQQQTGILSPPDNATSTINQQSQYEVQRTQLQVQVMALQQVWDALNTPEPDINPYLVSQASDPALSSLATSLAQANAALDALRVQFTGDAPEVQAQQAQVDQLQSAIRSMVSNDLTQEKTQLASIETLIGQFQDKMKTMPAQSLQVISLTRASDVFGQLYVLLMQKQQEAALSKAAAVSATRILTAAELPLGVSGPSPTVILAFATIVGLVLGVVFVTGRSLLAGRFETEREVRRLTRAQIFANIPARGKAELDFASSAFAEAFRMLRANIYHKNAGSPPQLITLTAAGLDENKTEVALNLANALVADGKRVLLIDGDLRAGSIHLSLGLEPAPGLTDLLHAGGQPYLQATAAERLKVITCGARSLSPAELLNKPSLAALLDAMRQHFDHIIVDSAAFPTVSDAIPFITASDLVISVVDLNLSTHHAVAAHEAAIAPFARFRAIVINIGGAEHSSAKTVPGRDARVAGAQLKRSNWFSPIPRRPAVASPAELRAVPINRKS